MSQNLRNSGGPVVDQSGALVGVATAVLESNFEKATGIMPQNVNFAVRSNVVELFLQGRDISYQPIDKSGTTVSTADLADKVVPTVVQILCRGPSPAAAENVASPGEQQAAKAD